MLSIYTSGIHLYILVFMLIDFLLLFTDYLILSLHNLTSMTTLVCITSLNLRTEVETDLLIVNRSLLRPNLTGYGPQQC